MTTKLSVSLSESDVEYIDELARSRSGNRSAAIHDLVRFARERAAVSDYATANDEWIDSGESRAWEAVETDGLGA
ncbi:ribbon-helix-helix domain-containing protein [Herbiconiux sp. CPCC 205763]|uniref:Ribbon-helix-helix domain-containing protein n=1 Tax=Herbiconiux aconitum TaxID=2970913 RepID=A0ABT2GT41_9MICO|nr:ribbon-helix-helix domain-containing protein [Herbiconiux aconitum]MCS5718470.1 ribbon-helix-helix domain-containing protein [Herbiconiux aconitum]